MKLRVKVDGTYVHVETLGEPEVRLYDKDGKYELLVRAIDVAAIFPTQEKLLILTRGSEEFTRKVRSKIYERERDGVRSHEEFEEILKNAADEVSK